MADTTGFSHITVSTDDDDDVVIQAGIAEETDDAAAVAACCEEAVEAEEEGLPAAASEPVAQEKSSIAQPRRAEDGYRETTLADIEGEKMTTTQKAVIVIALIGIAAFVAWYLFAR